MLILKLTSEAKLRGRGDVARQQCCKMENERLGGDEAMKFCFRASGGANSGALWPGDFVDRSGQMLGGARN